MVSIMIGEHRFLKTDIDMLLIEIYANICISFSDVHDEGKASNKKWRKGSKVGSEDGESKQKTKASLVSMISLVCS